ncbi:MAG: hypothetical protein MK228_02280 [Nitrososphaerales archaeon]|nr:hypothetical protein [Nitrososphaerales archaeon]
MNHSTYLSELEEIRKKQISDKVSKYRKFSMILAVIIHVIAFITGIVMLVVLSYSFTTMLVFHASMQILAYLNIFYGPKLYEKRLRKKVIKPDPMLLNRFK